MKTIFLLLVVALSALASCRMSETALLSNEHEITTRMAINLASFATFTGTHTGLERGGFAGFHRNGKHFNLHLTSSERIVSNCDFLKDFKLNGFSNQHKHGNHTKIINSMNLSKLKFSVPSVKNNQFCRYVVPRETMCMNHDFYKIFEINKTFRHVNSVSFPKIMLPANLRGVKLGALSLNGNQFYKHIMLSGTICPNHDFFKITEIFTHGNTGNSPSIAFHAKMPEIKSGNLSWHGNRFGQHVANNMDIQYNAFKLVTLK
jgi:hypothetical protein